MTSSSQWCQSILASPILEQYNPAQESQHFRQDDRMAKTPTGSYMQWSLNAKMHQGLAGKITKWERAKSVAVTNASQRSQWPLQKPLVVVVEAIWARWVGAPTKATEGGWSSSVLSGPVLWGWTGCSWVPDILEHLIFVQIQKQVPKLAST